MTPVSPRFTDILDGRGVPIRPIQSQYFAHLSQHWHTHRIHALSCPPGGGKSFIARTIQRSVPGTAIVTTNNLLVDQYVETYPELNGLKGKDYYDDLRDYQKARDRMATCPTVANPLSYYYYYLRRPDEPRPSTVIIDEAHKLADMLLMTVSKAFPCAHYGIPPDLDEPQFLAWLTAMVNKLKPVLNIVRPNAAQEKLLGKAESLFFLYDYLKGSLKRVKISYEQREDYRGKEQLCLVVTPLQLPVELIKTIFGSARLILMSGTLTKFDIAELFPGQAVDLVEYEPLAPLENRPIKHFPLSAANRKDINKWAERILEVYTAESRVNTVVHCSYGDAAQLAPILRKMAPDIRIHTHSKDTKNSVLENFKKQGGMLIAAGMAEGVDLPGDLCRCIIIPKLLYANIGDLAVIKRMALQNGQLWYSLNTMMTTIQQLGRGVRGETDWCHSYIFDPTLKRLVDATDKYLTRGLVASIHWEK